MQFHIICRPLRPVTLALALAICVPLVAAADDKDAVTSVVERNIAAFRDFDADRVSGTYADEPTGLMPSVYVGVAALISENF